MKWHCELLPTGWTSNCTITCSTNVFEAHGNRDCICWLQLIISQQSAKLFRWAKNLSYSMGADIQAVYVETSHKLTSKEREQLDKNINLAKQLGIKFRIITNNDIVKAIVDFAQKENITHIIVGKPRVRNLLSMFRLGNFVNRLIRYSGNIDVYILGSDSQAKDQFKEKVSIPSFTSNIRQYLITSIIVIFIICCLLSC